MQTRCLTLTTRRVLALLVLCLSGGVLWAQTRGRAFLMNDQVVPGWILKVDAGEVAWRTPNGRTGAFPLQNIREVRLELPEDFATALQELEKGASQQALSVLETYADPANPGNYHPVPGNLSSRAAWYLFQHHRAAGTSEQAARWAGALDLSLLPQEGKPSLFDLYRALGKDPGEEFHAEARAQQAEAPFALGLEIEYLMAVAYQTAGNLEKALMSYARVFSPAGGVLNPYGAFALERTQQILATQPPGTLADPAGLLQAVSQTKELLYPTPPESTP